MYRTAADNNPAWLQNRALNMRQSVLHKLPEEVLLRIRDLMDGPSREVVRRTCSLFLRLVSDIEILRYPNLEGLPRPYILSGFYPVWPLHGTDKERREQRKSVAALLDRDTQLCDPCRAYKESGRLDKTLKQFRQPMWCSGCDDDHPTLFFSFAQRSVPCEDRICIGREGQIPLCAHESLTWADWEKMKEQYCEVTLYTPWRARRDLPTKGCSDSPSIVVVGDKIVITWESPAIDLDPGVPVTRKQLQDYLVSQMDTLNHVICPHVALDDGQLLLPFEQNRCACFDDPVAAGHVPARMHRHKSWWQECCRCRSNNEHLANGRFLSSGVSHVYQCAECSSTYTWTSDGRLEFQIYLKPKKPTSGSWLRLLDPVTDDEDLRHVVWCDDTHCETWSRWSPWHIISLLAP